VCVCVYLRVLVVIVVVVELDAGYTRDTWGRETVRGNKSRKHRQELDSKPQPAGLYCSAPTAAPAEEYPVCMYRIYSRISRFFW